MADVFWTLPPVTRTLTAGAVVVSALGYSGMINFYNYFFIFNHVVTVRMVPQVWRLVSSFLITKPKFGILMDPYFLYQYGSGLESESSRFSQPGDFFIYTAFVMLTVVATAGGLLGGGVFLQALSLAYAWTYSQDSPTRQVNFFIINFDAKYLPMAMLLLTFIIDGPGAAYIQATGLVAAHLYDFLTRIWPRFGGGTNYIYTPAIVKQWFGGRGSTQARSYGSATAPNTRREGQGSTGRTTGFGGQWDGRGPGRRLGE